MNTASSRAFRALRCLGISLPGVYLEQTKRLCIMYALEHTGHHAIARPEAQPAYFQGKNAASQNSGAPQSQQSHTHSCLLMKL